MSVIKTVALLSLLTIYEVVSVGDQVGDRCRCINKETKPIGRHIAMLEVKPQNSHCPEPEIIATLKRDGQRVCLDPKAPWVRKVLERTNATQTT
ncbi:platelet factor 4-like [Salarias fasciatus]|uniref:Platelet factor 4-like n=1 Tax=Salarias fasciatus TaxID=181472 RepID=A0A672J088_SALFA|nr:platelet factor 4-like [Salarias fasciatus]XP_029949436.1 platelet factor 4-like [Salarias fasciatus]